MKIVIVTTITNSLLIATVMIFGTWLEAPPEAQSTLLGSFADKVI